MSNERTRIDIPDHGNLLSIQIELRRLRRPPIRRNLRKLAHDQRLNVGARRFLVIEIRANIANVRIGQADDLPGITWVGENFLIAGKTSIENDFAAAARDSAGSAAVKYAPVFERKDCGSMLNFRQWSLRQTSLFFARFRRGQRTKVIHRPVGKYCATVDKLARHRPKHTRIV